MARGLSREEAQLLIVRGFYQEIFDRIELEPVRDALQSVLEARLPRSVSCCRLRKGYTKLFSKRAARRDARRYRRGGLDDTAVGDGRLPARPGHGRRVRARDRRRGRGDPARAPEGGRRACDQSRALARVRGAGPGAGARTRASPTASSGASATSSRSPSLAERRTRSSCTESSAATRTTTRSSARPPSGRGATS